MRPFVIVELRDGTEEVAEIRHYARKPKSGETKRLANGRLSVRPLVDVEVAIDPLTERVDGHELVVLADRVERRPRVIALSPEERTDLERGTMLPPVEAVLDALVEVIDILARNQRRRQRNLVAGGRDPLTMRDGLPAEAMAVLTAWRDARMTGDAPGDGVGHLSEEEPAGTGLSPE